MDTNPFLGLFELLLSKAHMAFPLIGPFLGTLGAFYFQGWRLRQGQWRREHTSAEYTFFILESQHTVLMQVWDHQMEAHVDVEDRHLSLKNMHFESEIMPIDFPSIRFVLDSETPEVMNTLFEADHSFIGFVHTLRRRNDEYFRLQELGQNLASSTALHEITESLYKAHDHAVRTNHKARRDLARFLEATYRQKSLS